MTSILDTCDVTFQLCKTGQTVSVLATVKVKDNQSGITNTPIVFSGTAEELDEKLLPEFKSVLVSKGNQLSNIALMSKMIDEKEKETKEKAEKKSTTAKKAPAKKAEPKKEVSKDPPTKDMFAEKSVDAPVKAKEEPKPEPAKPEVKDEPQIELDW